MRFLVRQSTAHLNALVLYFAAHVLELLVSTVELAYTGHLCSKNLNFLLEVHHSVTERRHQFKGPVDSSLESDELLRNSFLDFLFKTVSVQLLWTQLAIFKELSK